MTLADAEHVAITRAIQFAHHNQQEAARLLQIHRSTLARKLQQYRVA